MHLSQPRVAPEVARDLLELIRVHGAPLLLQAMRAGGDPDFSCDGVHVIYCTPIQYFPHVFATVYRCRREGQPLHRDDIEAEPAHGELQVFRKGMKRVAVLLAPDRESYVVPLLDKVRLLAINERGLLLTGIEIYLTRGAKGTGPMFPQTWWCELASKPRTSIADPAAARQRERERQAREIGKTLLRRPTRRGKYEP